MVKWYPAVSYGIGIYASIHELQAKPSPKRSAQAFAGLLDQDAEHMQQQRADSFACETIPSGLASFRIPGVNQGSCARTLYYSATAEGIFIQDFRPRSSLKRPASGVTTC
ncbi:hypothetical protein PV325_006786 [Microctonus aethiopoides]|nr:hypothetical protein PV325_006786 [Microctonus aethiopoides]